MKHHCVTQPWAGHNTTAAIRRNAKHRRVTVFQTMFGFYLSSSRSHPRPTAASRAAAIGSEDSSGFLLLHETGTQLVAHAGIYLAYTHTHTYAAGYHLGRKCVIELSRESLRAETHLQQAPCPRHAQMHIQCAGLKHAKRSRAWSLDGPQKHKCVHVQCFNMKRLHGKTEGTLVTQV